MRKQQTILRFETNIKNIKTIIILIETFINYYEINLFKLRQTTKFNRQTKLMFFYF